MLEAIAYVKPPERAYFRRVPVSYLVGRLGQLAKLTGVGLRRLNHIYPCGPLMDEAPTARLGPRPSGIK